MQNIITRDDLRAAAHIEETMNGMSGILFTAERMGYEFTLEECRRVLNRICLTGTKTMEEVVLDVAISTNCPCTLTRSAA